MQSSSTKWKGTVLQCGHENTMKDKAMNMLSTGLGLSADVNLSKIPFPNRIIGKTLCSSLERTDLASKLSSKPMQQNLSSWFSLPMQTGAYPCLRFSSGSFDGTFSESKVWLTSWNSVLLPRRNQCPCQLKLPKHNHTNAGLVFPATKDPFLLLTMGTEM